MKKLIRAIFQLFGKLMGKKNIESFLIFGAKSIDVDLHKHALIDIGAGGGYQIQDNGEKYFVEYILGNYLDSKSNLIFFDVGANNGEYSTLLRSNFEKADIYSFEPVYSTFTKLLSNTQNLNIIVENLGMGDVKKKAILYSFMDDTKSEGATLYKEALHNFADENSQIQEIEFEVDTIDNYCFSKKIDKIDFLKIDVEGHELSVLIGAKKMISNGKIDVVQFELNIHNIYSKVFLRDFYEVLPNYNFYRIKQDSIKAIGGYSINNEIFTFQNILAIRNR